MSQISNVAFIDGANLHKGIQNLGWSLDYARFRVWLREQYGVDRAYIFLGNIPKYSSLYSHLQRVGYVLIFKQTVYDGDGKPKGNCDADLVVEAMRQMYENECDQVILVSSDGDYASLVSFLMSKKRFRVLLSPASSRRCSILLKRTGTKITFLEEFRHRLSENKKAPDADETA